MKLIRASMTIPEDVYEESKKFSDNFSSLVTEALREYLKKENIRKAMESFGSWEEREEESAETVNKMRTETGRQYASRNN